MKDVDKIKDLYNLDLFVFDSYNDVSLIGNNFKSILKEVKSGIVFSKNVFNDFDNVGFIILEDIYFFIFQNDDIDRVIEENDYNMGVYNYIVPNYNYSLNL